MIDLRAINGAYAFILAHHRPSFLQVEEYRAAVPFPGDATPGGAASNDAAPPLPINDPRLLHNGGMPRA